MKDRHMKIKIKKEDERGFAVYREVNGKWKFWLPEDEVDARGDVYTPYFTSMKKAEKAARAEKKRLEQEAEVILEI